MAVDLCARTKATRIHTVLARLGVHGDPCLTWAALECALKLRRRGVWFLLDAELSVEPEGEGARVCGIGDDVVVSWRACDGYALAWAYESEPDAVTRKPALRVEARTPSIEAFGVARLHRSRLA